jgi:hypothetical protein
MFENPNIGVISARSQPQAQNFVVGDTGIALLKENFMEVIFKP